MPYTLLDDDEPQPQQGGYRVLEDRRDPKIGKPEELTFGEKVMQGVSLPGWMDKLIGTARGVAQGAADPIVGTVQLAANVVGAGDTVNKRIAEQNQQYETLRAASGRDGVDAARIVGNVVSPANLAIASRVPAVAGAAARAGQGALVGGASGAMAPVENAEDGFWSKKAAQVGTGAATGAVLTPALGAIAERVTRALKIGRNVNARASVKEIDDTIAQSLQDAGQTLDDVPPDQLAALRQQVATAMEGGQGIDAAAAMRKADFEALNIKPTAGQVTRDPVQYARELRLAGVEEAGDPLASRFNEQSRALQDRLGGMARGAKPEYEAGAQLSESLANTDKVLRRHVDGLYGEARASAAKDLDVPIQGLASEYGRILEEYGEAIPAALRTKFASYGMDPALPASQRKVFTFEEANRLLSTINKMGGDKTTNSALGELRRALRTTVQEADAGDGPFAPAVRAASERFKLHDAIPALQAASEGTVAADDFVRRFVVNGKTDDVKGMANVLKQTDPASYQEAKVQIAEVIRRAAYGESGESGGFASERYLKTLRALGPAKLGAFFTKEEVADLMRVGRVGSAITRRPAGAPVNNSNTASAALSLLSRVPGLGGAISLGKAAAGAVKDQATVRTALAAEVPTSQVPLYPRAQNYLTKLLAFLAAGGGAAAGAGMQ